MEIEKPEQEQEQLNLGENGSQQENGQPAQLHTEADLKDHDSDHSEEHFEEDYKQEDYSKYSKKDLAALIKEIAKDDNFKKVDYIVREIKPLFDEIQNRERQEALDKFVNEGSAKEDFDYKGDQYDVEFEANLKLIRDRKSQHAKSQEERKSENLSKKELILEKLRELIDTDSNNQFDSFKELQKEWKAIGSVPAAQARTLWANYHALVDRFYDNQSIYFELKELDRKKNLESKIELCERAEKLAEVEIIKDAVRELNELHHEFKHIGPVPMDDKESVWQRFKAASDAVYQRRDSFMQNLQQELGANMDKKLALCAELEEFPHFTSDRIKEWNKKTKEILEIQKKWEIIGGLPRVKAKEVNKKFWTAFKAFFNNKNAFFKKLDEEREQNLQLKTELVKRAQELKESSNWEETSNELKSLQTKWKDIGPVPEKVRDQIFQEFKEACDHFFNQRRSQQGRSEHEQVGNLEKKKAICETLRQHIENDTANLNVLKELQAQYDEVGFVPKKDLAQMRDQYNEIVNTFIDSIKGVTDEDKSRIIMENQINGLKDDPNADKKIYHKEQAIRKKISKVENDITLWRNNLEFFANSRNADKVKEEFNEKIEAASGHLKQLKQQLRLLRTVS